MHTDLNRICTALPEIVTAYRTIHGVDFQQVREYLANEPLNAEDLKGFLVAVDIVEEFSDVMNIQSVRAMAYIEEMGG